MDLIEAAILFVVGVVLAVVVSFLQVVPLWYIWNWLVPHLFDGPTITLMEAFGLGLLSALLFKSRPSSSNKK